MIQDYVNVDDGRIFYTLSGIGEPIILLHGNFNDHQIWDNQADFLSEHHQVIRYDLRGYGLSSTPNRAFSNVADLKALVDTLKLQKLTLIGSSSGGGVAVDFALAYPKLVQALILVSPSINGKALPAKLMWKGIQNYIRTRLKGHKAAIESFITDSFWQYFFPSISKEEARNTVLLNVRNARNFCRFSPSLATAVKPYAIHRLQEINVPTLVIITEQDHPFNIKTAELVNNTIPQSSKIIMRNCGHLPFVEEPNAFNEIVLDFLRSEESCYSRFAN